MTDERKELIERWAREAGITFEAAGPADNGVDTWFGDQYLPSGALSRFAALVRADALEEAAKVCDAKGPELLKWWGDGPAQANAAAQECATAIRQLIQAP